MTYRPQQWQSQSPQKVIINFPGQGAATQYSSSASGNVVLPTGPTMYAFDAEITIEHQQQLRKTEHPVQTGANISDHAYIVPARLVLDVVMSDGVDAYFSPSTWSGSTSKSVAAYQTMLALQFSRIPLSITTKLRTYQNMVIENLIPQENAKTFAGARMRVEFGQIFMANVSQTSTSARPQDTNTTNLGTVNPQPPTAAQVQQNNVAANPDFTETLQYNAVGAGSQSSVNTDNLGNLPAPK